jgi:hypothetical protein
MRSLFAKARGSTILVLSLLVALFTNTNIVKASMPPAVLPASNAQVLHEDPGRDVTTLVTSNEVIRPAADFQAWCLENPAKSARKSTTENIPAMFGWIIPSVSEFPLLSHENGKYVFYSNLVPLVATTETNLRPVSSPRSLPLSEEMIFANIKQIISFG